MVSSLSWMLAATRSYSVVRASKGEATSAPREATAHADTHDSLPFFLCSSHHCHLRINHVLSLSLVARLRPFAAGGRAVTTRDRTATTRTEHHAGIANAFVDRRVHRRGIVNPLCLHRRRAGCVFVSQSRSFHVILSLSSSADEEDTPTAAAAEPSSVASYAAVDDMNSDGIPITNAAAAAAASPSSSPRPTGRWRPALEYVNESTKFVVSALAFATLVAFPNVQTCWCVLGSVVNSLNGKILKKVLNHERPEGAVKADPGMPSSHAVSLSFLSVYAAAALIIHGGGTAAAGGVVPPWAVFPGAGSLVAAGVFLTWLRVTLGYHTPPQVRVSPLAS